MLTVEQIKSHGKVSAAKFAKLAGISRQNIYQITKAGTIVRGDDLQYDCTDTVNIEYILDQGRRAKNQLAQKNKDDEETQELRGTKEELERRKLEEQVKALEIKNQEKRSELIPRELVARVFSRLHAIDQTEFGNLGQNLAPQIIAIAGIDESKEIEIQAEIERQVWKALRNSKKQSSDFLKSLQGGEDEP